MRLPKIVWVVWGGGGPPGYLTYDVYGNKKFQILWGEYTSNCRFWLCFQEHVSANRFVICVDLCVFSQLNTFIKHFSLIIEIELVHWNRIACMLII